MKFDQKLGSVLAAIHLTALYTLSLLFKFFFNEFEEKNYWLQINISEHMSQKGHVDVLKGKESMMVVMELCSKLNVLFMQLKLHFFFDSASPYIIIMKLHFV